MILPPTWRGWRNTVGSLIEILWLKRTNYRPQCTGNMRGKRRGTVSSHPRFQTALCQQPAAAIVAPLGRDRAAARQPDERAWRFGMIVDVIVIIIIITVIIFIVIIIIVIIGLRL